MKNRDSFGPLVVMAVVVTTDFTCMVEYGWLAWLPVLAALAVVSGFRQKFQR